MEASETARSVPVALITGASQGIGAACARSFLAGGWNVSTLTLDDADLGWLHRSGVLVTVGDVASEQIRQQAVEETLEKFGRIDALINNAGVGLYALPTETSSNLFSRLLEVNAVAPLALAQLVIPVMLAQRSGVLVTVGSVAGDVALPWAAAYSASKAALHAMHDALRLELRSTPLHLVKICPGIVETRFREHVLDGQPPRRVREISRVIEPEMLAAVIFAAVRRRSKRSIYAPRVGSLFSAIGGFMPRLMDLYLSRMLSSTKSSTTTNPSDAK